jgi:hypothetical protein
LTSNTAANFYKIFILKEFRSRGIEVLSNLFHSAY